LKFERPRAMGGSSGHICECEFRQGHLGRSSEDTWFNRPTGLQETTVGFARPGPRRDPGNGLDAPMARCFPKATGPGNPRIGVLQTPVLLERPPPVAIGTNHAVSDGRFARPVSAAGPVPERARPRSGPHEPRTPLKESPGTSVVRLTRSVPISAQNLDYSPHAQGFIAATNMKFAGNDSEPRARLIVTR